MRCASLDECDGQESRVEFDFEFALAKLRVKHDNHVYDCVSFRGRFLCSNLALGVVRESVEALVGLR